MLMDGSMGKVGLGAARDVEALMDCKKRGHLHDHLPYSHPHVRKIAAMAHFHGADMHRDPGVQEVGDIDVASHHVADIHHHDLPLDHPAVGCDVDRVSPNPFPHHHDLPGSGALVLSLVPVEHRDLHCHWVLEIPNSHQFLEAQSFSSSPWWALHKPKV